MSNQRRLSTHAFLTSKAALGFDRRSLDSAVSAPSLTTAPSLFSDGREEAAAEQNALLSLLSSAAQEGGVSVEGRVRPAKMERKAIFLLGIIAFSALVGLALHGLNLLRLSPQHMAPLEEEGLGTHP